MKMPKLANTKVVTAPCSDYQSAVLYRLDVGLWIALLSYTHDDSTTILQDFIQQIVQAID